MEQPRVSRKFAFLPHRISTLIRISHMERKQFDFSNELLKKFIYQTCSNKAIYYQQNKHYSLSQRNHLPIYIQRACKLS